MHSKNIAALCGLSQQNKTALRVLRYTYALDQHSSEKSLSPSITAIRMPNEHRVGRPKVATLNRQKSAPQLRVRLLGRLDREHARSSYAPYGFTRVAWVFARAAWEFIHGFEFDAIGRFELCPPLIPSCIMCIDKTLAQLFPTADQQQHSDQRRAQIPYRHTPTPQID